MSNNNVFFIPVTFIVIQPPLLLCPVSFLIAGPGDDYAHSTMASAVVVIISAVTVMTPIISAVTVMAPVTTTE
jgi:hypothetical protein